MIGGLEVTGVTYPGGPPHSKPHRAITTTASASCQPPGQALLCQTRRKEILWLENADGMSVKPQKTKGLTKRWNMTAKPWISTIQSRTSSISATERLLRLEARKDSNDTLFMVAEHLFWIQMGHKIEILVQLNLEEKTAKPCWPNKGTLTSRSKFHFLAVLARDGQFWSDKSCKIYKAGGLLDADQSITFLLVRKNCN